MKKLKVYLDNCCFNRPFDSQEQEKILLETEAKLRIQLMVKNNELELVWSYMLDYENGENPNDIIRAAIAEWKNSAVTDIVESEELLKNAETIAALGIDGKDAIHIACAIAGGAHLFFTTDNDIIKKGSAVSEVKILNPVRLFIEGEEMEVYL